MATRKLPKEAIKKFKEAGYRLPHGYEVVKVTKRKPAKATKKVATKKTTSKKKLVKKVTVKKTVAKKTSTKKPTAKQLAARKKFAAMAKKKSKQLKMF